MNLQIELTDELKNQLAALHSELAEIKTNLQPKEPQKYLTKKETAELLKVNLSTLFNWQRTGVLTPVQLGGRVYFRVKDIESAIVELEK
jgi:hypothetical protein